MKINRGTLLVFGFGIFIFVLSVIPSDMAGENPNFFFPGIDKLIHAIIYALFSFLVFREYYRNRDVKISSLLIIGIAVWSYSILMELVQLFLVNYRSGDWKDALANLAGIILGIITGMLMRRRKIKY